MSVHRAFAREERRRHRKEVSRFRVIECQATGSLTAMGPDLQTRACMQEALAGGLHHRLAGCVAALSGDLGAKAVQKLVLKPAKFDDSGVDR